jgi:hypothetical protein
MLTASRSAICSASAFIAKALNVAELAPFP